MPNNYVEFSCIYTYIYIYISFFVKRGWQLSRIGRGGPPEVPRTFWDMFGSNIPSEKNTQDADKSWHVDGPENCFCFCLTIIQMKNVHRTIVNFDSPDSFASVIWELWTWNWYGLSRYNDPNATDAFLDMLPRNLLCFPTQSSPTISTNWGRSPSLSLSLYLYIHKIFLKLRVYIIYIYIKKERNIYK